MVLPITHFSDVLCVWAYVSQIRLDELQRDFDTSISVDCRFLSVFGSVPEKLRLNWQHRGGAAGFRDHVHTACKRFTHVELHEDIWACNTPQSSTPAHLFLCAIRLLERERCGATATDWSKNVAWKIRQAFFCDLRDISRRQVLFEIGEELSLDVRGLEHHLNSGAAHALLAEDLKAAGEQGVKVSPSLVLDGGRQLLSGNVGYRIIEANVRELLNHPDDECSWC